MFGLDKQKTSFLIISSFAFICLISFLYNDQISEYAKDGNVWGRLFLYVITNPLYLGVIAYLASKYDGRGLLASIFVIVALDIQSLPHSISSLTGILPTEGALFLFIDSIIYQQFAWIGTFNLYVTLPVILVIIAYEIVRPNEFVSIFKKTVGV